MHHFGKFFKKNITKCVYVYKIIRAIMLGQMMTLPIYKV